MLWRLIDRHLDFEVAVIAHYPHTLIGRIEVEPFFTQSRSAIETGLELLVGLFLPFQEPLFLLVKREVHIVKDILLFLEIFYLFLENRAFLVNFGQNLRIEAIEVIFEVDFHHVMLFSLLKF